MATEIIDDRLLTVMEFAAFLNVKVSTIRAWCLRRRISFCRVNGRAVRIPFSEAQRIVKAGMVPARENKRAFE
jgi:excisionase family DNA binding protein